MSYQQQAKELPVEVIQDILQQYGSIQSVVKYITGGKQNEGVRSIISGRVKDLELISLHKGNISTRYTPEQLITAFNAADCWSDVYRSLGLSICGHNKRSIQRFADHHNIPIPQFSKEQMRGAYRRGGKTSRSDENVYCVNSDFPRSQLRKRVVRDGVIKYYHCSVCSVGSTWNGEDLCLELDHVNGISNDNRVENLRWLCPNCHSQTHTYRGKNK